MRILATAHPSETYRWYQSIRDFVIQARLTNNRLYYYEVSLDGNRPEKCLPEATVKALFPTGIPLRDRPFSIKENRDFYTVLNRNRNRFRADYQKLKNPRL